MLNHGTTRRFSARFLALAAAAGINAAAMAVVPGGAAHAQGAFRWPWEDPPPRPREPVNRAPAAPIPAPIPGPQGAAPGGQQWMTRNPLCAQLEQRLVVENQKGAQTRDLLPKIDADMRATDQTYQQGQRQLERADCYDYFLFTKTLRSTRQCRDLDNQVEAAKRRLADLETQRQQIMAASGRSYTDDIVRELARNNCGVNYQQEASRGAGPGGGSVWQDSEIGGGASGGFGSSQYATFRTVCVRLCDGYFFPISFSTLPGHFQQDADACQSKCAAPVELYYHPNPGGTIEQAMSLKAQEPYTRLKTAFRYRKEYVQGCSCKEAEYVPPAGTAPLPVGPAGATSPDRRAETLPWEKTTTQRQ